MRGALGTALNALRRLGRLIYAATPLAALVRRANQDRDAGRFAAAAEGYRAALALAPNRLSLKLQLGNMLKDSGRYDEAEAVYDAALKQAPGKADIYMQLGHVRKLTGRRAEALACYARALAQSPTLEAAKRELVEAGEPSALADRFEEQLRQGGPEAFLTLRVKLDQMARQIETLRAALPEASSLAAWPVEVYGEMRRLFDPWPPEGARQALVFGVVLLADREPLAGLHHQLAAIRTQSHEAWRLTVVGRDEARRAIVVAAAAQDPRIAWIEASETETTAHGEMRAARAAAGDWTLFLAQAARLHRHALAWIAAAAARTGCAATFADEEIGADEADGPLEPVLRFLADPDAILEDNPYGETLALSAAVLNDFADIISQAPSPAAARWAVLSGLIGRQGVAHIPLPLSRRIPGAAAQPAPPRSPRPIVHTTRAEIAMVIPTKNNVSDVCAFVESLIAKAHAPSLLEILVINNGEPAADDPRLRALGAHSQVTVRDLPEPFNWSRFSNLGAAWTTAPLLIFANDDMLMLSADWDQVVRAHLDQPQVGALGARLLYPDMTVQHAGILFDWKGSVIHDGLHRPEAEPGPGGRWRLTRAVSAVTGAFLCTRRADFDTLGGFDAVRMPVAYSDVDYCLKLRAEGRRVVCSPKLSLLHYESKTRGLDHLDPGKAARNAVERALIEKRWPGVFTNEPSLSPMWRQATMPFRLLTIPSDAELWAYIERSGAVTPWRVAPPRAAP